MVWAPVRLIIPSLKLGDYLSVQAHKPCSISHLVESLFGSSEISIAIAIHAVIHKTSMNKCHMVRASRNNQEAYLYIYMFPETTYITESNDLRNIICLRKT